MPENKYLWRASIRRVSLPLYLVAQNVASAHAQATNHPQVASADLTSIQRVGPWDDAQNMTIVPWPAPEPDPEPEPEPTP